MPGQHTERGLFVGDVIAFIRETQPREWEYLANLQKEKAEETLIDDLCRALNSSHEGRLSGAGVLVRWWGWATANFLIWKRKMPSGPREISL